MEQEVLGQAAEDDVEAAERLRSVTQELGALEMALDQLGAQAGLSPRSSEDGDSRALPRAGAVARCHPLRLTPGILDTGEGYEEYSLRTQSRFASARRTGSTSVRGRRGMPPGANDREAAWARAHSHAFGRASETARVHEQPDGGAA